MPYTTRVQDYQTAVAGNGGTVTTPQLDALNNLVLAIEAVTGLSAKIKELHIPTGDANAAAVRLWFKSGAQIATLGGYAGATGATGSCTSGIAALTDIDYTSFSMGVLLADGFSPSDFEILLGGNGDNFNFTAYDFDGGASNYDRVVGQSLVFGPTLGTNLEGETFLHLPAWSGLIAASGGTSEHFFARDGEVIFHRPVRMWTGSMTTAAIYLPRTTEASWHASFIGSYLTRTELAIVATAIRLCVETFGRSNVPARKTRRLVCLGDSRTYTTKVDATPYAETFYKQLRESLGWTNATADVWDYGINGRKMQVQADDTATFPALLNAEKIFASRATGPRQGRLVVVFGGVANDILTGRTAIQAKADMDTCLTRLRAAGACPVLISEPISYGAANPTPSAVAVTYNGLLGADANLVNGTKAYALVRIDAVGVDLDPDDTGDSFDGVHLTEAGTAKVVAAVVAAMPKVLAVPTINSASSGTAVRGEAFSHQVTVNTTLSIGPYTYAATGLPTGLSIDTATGLISGTPTAAAGGYTITITATNDNGSSTAQTFNLTLQPGYTAMPELYEDYRNWVTATGRFILTPADDTENPIDLGDISITRLGVNPQETKAYRNRGGTRKLINQKLIEISPEFEITISEENRFNVGIRLFGKQLTDENQASATGATKTFSNVKHGSIQDLGKVNVTNVSVAVGASVKVLGTDYAVDAALGLIRILDGGGIVSGTDDIVVTFDHPAQGYSKFQTFVKLNRSGRGKLFVEDEYSDAPRGIHEFDVNVATSDPGEMGAQKPTEWKAKLSILGNATYKHRKLAA